jgi:hypothetical protein
VDAAGHTYVTGMTESEDDFPITPDAFQPEPGGGGYCGPFSGCPDAFITKIAH